MEQLICCSIKVQPARSGPRHLAAPRKEFPSPQRTPGSEAGVCPPLAAKRREPPFDGCVPSNECSASPEWLGTLAMPRHGEPLARVPRGETVHWTVSPPLLSLLTLKFFRSLRAATKDSGLISRFGRRLVCAPLAHGAFGICDFLKKIE